MKNKKDLWNGEKEILVFSTIKNYIYLGIFINKIWNIHGKLQKLKQRIFYLKNTFGKILYTSDEKLRL